MFLSYFVDINLSVDWFTQLEDSQKKSLHYEVVSIESQSDLNRKKANLGLMNFISSKMESPPELASPQEGEVEESGDNSFFPLI